MLYATTRSKVATYTAQRALKENRAPDGGLYVPTRFPRYGREELAELMKKSSGAIVAEVMNQFFGGKISQWDVEFQLGKRLFGLTEISHRIVIGELWNNSTGFEELCRRLTRMASVEVGISEPGLWMRIACRIALNFAVFAQLYQKKQISFDEPVDIAVLTADFEGPYAAWASGQMGLNIGTVVCCCNENGGVWDLINRGQMKLNTLVRKTCTPDCDVAVPEALELLLFSKLEWDDVEEFLDLKKRGGTYYLSAEEHRHFAGGLYACVVGDSRVKTAIPNLYRTNGYILCPYSALVYTGLMDYRSRRGRGRAALMLTDTDPRKCSDTVIRALAISDQELRDWCLGR